MGFYYSCYTDVHCSMTPGCDDTVTVVLAVKVLLESWIVSKDCERKQIFPFLRCLGEVFLSQQK